jgi:hypothetical protein
MFSKLFRCRTVRPSSSRPAARRLGFRPSLEALEGRFMPSTFQWVSEGDGNFNDPSNWLDQSNNPGVPTVGDTAIIDEGDINVTLPANVEVYKLTDAAHLILPSGVSLTVDSSSTINGALDNAGTVNVNNAGTKLTLTDGGSSSGTFNTSNSTGTLEFYGGAPANWNAGIQFTGSGLLDVIGSVNVNAPLTINVPMQLDSSQPATSGDIVDNGGLTIADTLNWTGGTIGGNSTNITQLGASATTTIDANNNAVVDTGHVLQNAGTVNWVGGSFIVLNTNSIFTNQAGGTFNVLFDGQLKTNGTGTTFNNAGVFNMEGPVGTGTTLVGPAFNSSHVVHVSSGTLSLSGGAATGSFQVDSGAQLGFVSGTYTVNAGATISGTGLVDVASTVTVNEPLTVAKIQVDAPGDLVDDGNVSITGTLSWTGGTIGGSSTNITQLGAYATTTINSTGRVYVDSGHLLQNAGIVNWVGGIIELNSSTASITNQASGMFNAACDASMVVNGASGGTFTNAGVFNKTSSAGTGTTTMGSTFNTTGTVDVQSGILAIEGLGTATGGQFITAAGDLVEFNDVFGNYTLNSGTTFSGPGTADLIAGTLNVNGNVAASVFQLDGGTLTGTGNLTTSGTFTWNGGAISDPNGSFTIPVGATFNIQNNSSKTLSAGTLNLFGTTNWMGSGDLTFSGAATIANNSGAVFNILNDQKMSGSGVFTNNGLLSKVSGSSTTTIAIRLNNAGRVEVHSNMLSVTGSVDQVSGATLTGGTWAVFGSTGIPSSLSLASAPNLTTIGSFANVQLTGATASFTNLSALNTVAGQLSVFGGQTFTTPGALSVTGVLGIDPTSTVTVAGNFTLAAGATLNIQMGGTNATPTIGHVAATGTVTLAGKLNMTSTVLPALHSKFTLVNNQGSNPISGTFAGLPEGSTFKVNGATYKISYLGGNGRSVVVTRIK